MVKKTQQPGEKAVITNLSGVAEMTISGRVQNSDKKARRLRQNQIFEKKPIDFRINIINPFN